MGKFIYVFDAAARDMLAQAGFLLLKSDERNHMWVFAEDESVRFDLERADFSMIRSDRLTF